MTPNKSDSGELRENIEAILENLYDGETRVTYPNGESRIVNNYSLAVDDIIQALTAHIQAVGEAVIKLDAETLERIGSKVDRHRSHVPAYSEIVKEQLKRLAQYLGENK